VTREPVVVTGIGAMSPVGLTASEHWTATVAGTCGVARVTRFDPAPYPSTLAGEVTDFAPSDHFNGRMLAQTDRVTQMALVISDEAFADAKGGLERADSTRVGVVTASSAGGFEFGHRELHKLWSEGPGAVSAYQSFAWFYAANTGQISIRHGLRGPSGVVVTDQAGGLDAVALATRHVRFDADVMLAGSVDGSFCPWGWVAAMAGGGMTTVEDPTRAYTPFDVAASGYVPGEGGALLVLESRASASARGATCHGEIAGYASGFCSSRGEPGAVALQKIITGALADAGRQPSDIGVVYADAAGTPDGDHQEARAIRAVFGAYGVPVTVPKTGTGRLRAAAGALDVATALFGLRDGVIPPAVNVATVDPRHEMDLVRTPIPLRRPCALMLAQGRGGFRSALVLSGE
jgi:act minimal PKS chain-length factor (CLF/KS beta)